MVTTESQQFIGPIGSGRFSNLISPSARSPHHRAAAGRVDAGGEEKADEWVQERGYIVSEIRKLVFNALFCGCVRGYPHFSSSLRVLNERHTLTWKPANTVDCGELESFGRTLEVSSSLFFHPNMIGSLMTPSMSCGMFSGASLASSPRPGLTWFWRKLEGITEAPMKTHIFKIHSPWKWQAVPYWWSGQRFW